MSHPGPVLDRQIAARSRAKKKLPAMLSDRAPYLFSAGEVSPTKYLPTYGVSIAACHCGGVLSFRASKGCLFHCVRLAKLQNYRLATLRVRGRLHLLQAASCLASLSPHNLSMCHVHVACRLCQADKLVSMSRESPRSLAVLLHGVGGRGLRRRSLQAWSIGDGDTDSDVSAWGSVGAGCCALSGPSCVYGSDTKYNVLSVWIPGGFSASLVLDASAQRHHGKIPGQFPITIW
jgi:hypothetical protein